MSKEVKSQIYYLARRGWHDQLAAVCDGHMAKKGKDPTCVFWKAFALGMTGNLSEASRLLETFQARRDMQYPATLALIYFNRRSRNVDHDLLSSLQSELSVSEDVVKEAGIVMASRFALFTGDMQTAIRLSRKLLRSNTPSTPYEVDAYAIEFWANISLMSGSGDLDWKYLDSIGPAVKNLGDNADLDLYMLWARSRYMSTSPKKNDQCLDVFNKVIAVFPWFGYGLSEKAVLLASMGQWDQALDTAQRALDADSENLDALKVIAVHAFLLDAHPGDAARKLQDYDNAVSRCEPSGSAILLEACQLFSRICNRQPRSLEICRAMLERALKIKPDDGAILVEIANVQVLQRQYSSALKAYAEASKRNKNDMSALEGNVKCHILLGELEDAEAQMELLEMMQMSPEEASPEYYLLRSMLMLKQIKSRNTDVEAAMKNQLVMLENAYFTFFRRFDETVKGFLEPLKELVVMDTGFMMQMAMGFAAHMENQMPVFLPPSSSTNNSGSAQNFSNGSLAAIAAESASTKTGEPDELSHAVETGISLLKRILQKAPGCVPAYLELAKILAGLSKHDEACKVLRQCLGMLPNCAAALLLTARIECSRYNTAAANRALEQALSGNFAIRRVLLFRYTQAVVRAQQGRTDEALTEIIALSQIPELAISMSGGVSAMGSVEPGDASELEDSFLDLLEITDDDRVALIIAHATLLSKAGKSKESAKLLSDARVNFTGSSMEVHLLIASAQLSMDRGDFEGAIRHLDKIKPESSSFYRAQLMKGEILLVHNHDKEAFTKCYQSLVESDPSSKNYTLLGEAYLRILNPERAVDAFENARRLDSSNTKLRVRIGKALIATHEYHRAVSFYENILNDSGEEMSPEIILLSHDLSKLYVKLGRIESACRVLQAVIHPTYRDISEMQLDVKTLELLSFATSQHSVGNAASVGDADDRDTEDIIGHLSRARQIQIDVVSQSRSNSTSSSEAVDRERAILSSIDEKIAKLYIDLKDFSKAETFVTEAIQHNPQNTKAMHQMAQVYLSRNETDQCANQLRKVLLADPSDESAAVLLSNVAFKDSDAADDAIRPLRELLVINPTSYRALAKMITMLRRVGKLDEVPALFSRAESANKRSASHPGMHYCKGLYYRYTNDLIKAITEFNCSRTDSQWGADSLIHMIELYLNPDQDGVWEERDSSSVIGEEVAENISVAERLLSELRPICKDTRRVQVLQNYLLLSTKQKRNVEEAMASFIQLLEEDQNYLPAILGMATGFMIEKSEHKALNLLKRVAKLEMSKQDGEDFERANILLAKFHVDKGKHDLAQELCKRCLMHNKSCSQAWDVLGLAMEKEMDYEHSYECYEKAWKLEFEASAPIGYKLAFSYMKCRKYVEAIDVCEKVLAQYPDYPRIREEILRKCQNSIRSSNNNN